MSSRRLLLSAVAPLLLAAPPAAFAESRGELLYSTHCIACHTTQMHWRDQRLATDWTSLKALVRRWQGTAQLSWNDDDIVEVARFLNERFYRFPQTSDPVTSSTGHDPFTAASRPDMSMQGIHGECDAGTAPAHPAPVRPAGARGASEVASSPSGADSLRSGLGSRRG